MRGIPPPSFGRPAEPEPEPDPGGPVILPPVILPPVQLPVVLVVDVDSLRLAAEQIQAMVTDAVRAGFAAAIDDIEYEQRRPHTFTADTPKPAHVAHLG